MRTNRFVRRKRKLKDLPDIEDWAPYELHCRRQMAGYDACPPAVRKALRNAVCNIDGPETAKAALWRGQNYVIEGIETNNECFIAHGVYPLVNEE